MVVPCFFLIPVAVQGAREGWVCVDPAGGSALCTHALDTAQVRASKARVKDSCQG
jgi:hypothetical protein